MQIKIIHANTKQPEYSKIFNFIFVRIAAVILIHNTYK